MRTYTALAALLLVAAALVSVPALARGDAQTQLRLLVVDRTQSVLPAATVTIRPLNGDPAARVTADSIGLAQFPSLSAGPAEVVVEFPGFTPYVQKTTLARGENAQIVTLDLAPFQEAVTITADGR